MSADQKMRAVIVAAILIWSGICFALGRLGRDGRAFDEGFAEGSRWERRRKDDAAGMRNSGLGGTL